MFFVSPLTPVCLLSCGGVAWCSQSGTTMATYVIGYSLQIFWFKKIVKGAMKALSKSGAKSSNKKK